MVRLTNQERTWYVLATVFKQSKINRTGRLISFSCYSVCDVSCIVFRTKDYFEQVVTY